MHRTSDLTAAELEAPRRRVDKAASTLSPAYAEPASAALEARVGAQYLLPLLTTGAARG